MNPREIEFSELCYHPSFELKYLTDEEVVKIKRIDENDFLKYFGHLKKSTPVMRKVTPNYTIDRNYESNLSENDVMNDNLKL